MTAPRPAPRLASDIARSWIAIGIGMPFVVAVPFLAFVAPELLPLQTFDDPRTLYSGTFYVAWTIFCLATVISTIAVFHRATPEELRRWLDATRAPDGRWRRFWWSFNGGGAASWAVTGSLVAMLALVELALSSREMPLVFVIAGVAVVPASIAVIIVTFAVSHARRDAGRGLDFPGDAPPRFADYLYFSVQVTTTFGGSDVAILTTSQRRGVALHSLLAFAYNAFVVALLVSVLLGVVLR